jgi:drug/metabolite transporter (DMT)-like permease
MPYVLFLLVCAIWGSSFILMKKATLVFSSLEVGAWRVASGALVLGLLWRLHGRGWPLARRDLGPLAFVVLVGYAWPYSIQPELVARHGSAFIGMTVSFVPLLTIAASVPLLGIYPSRRQVVGVLGGLACMLALLAEGLQRRIPPVDLLLAGSVPLNYALTNICIRRRLNQAPSLGLSFASLAATSLFLLPLACWTAGEAPRSQPAMPLAVASLAALGVLGTGLATYAFNKLIQDQGPLFAGMVTYLVPVGAMAWGWVDQETITWGQLVALAGILTMVFLVQYRAAGPQADSRSESSLRPTDANRKQS